MSPPIPTEPIPPKMKAWTYSTRGPIPKVLHLTNTHPTPNPSTLAPGTILVKIAYAAFTPSASALVPILPNLSHTLPAIPELEFSGTIVALGPGVSTDKHERPELKIGATVFGGTSIGLYFKGYGTLAEYCPVPVDQVAVCDGVSLRDAAALAGSGVTAVNVFERALRPAIVGVGASASATGSSGGGETGGWLKGKRVLINGGSGATGTMMVQIARVLVGDGKVVVVCSERNAEMVMRLGADETINYKTHNPLHNHFSKNYNSTPFDFIIDTIGLQDLYTHSPSYLTKNGRYVNIGAMNVQSGVEGLLGFAWSQFCNLFWPKLLGGTPREYKMVTTTQDQEMLLRTVQLVKDGLWSPVVDSVWEVEDVLEAYKKLHSQRAQGTILIRIGG